MKTSEIIAQLSGEPKFEMINEGKSSEDFDRNIGIFVHTLEEGGSQRAVEYLIDRLAKVGGTGL